MSCLQEVMRGPRSKMLEMRERRFKLWCFGNAHWVGGEDMAKEVE